jgi:hypothetical protein
MIPLPSLMGGRSREHSRLAKASVENIIIIMAHLSLDGEPLLGPMSHLSLLHTSRVRSQK